MDRTEFEALSPRHQVQKVLNVMAEVVAEFGHDHEYLGACAYVCGVGNNASPYDNAGQPRPADELAPDCIVAQVLVRLGYDLAMMLPENTESVDRVAWAQGLHEQTRLTLRIAQASQDGWSHLTTEGGAFGYLGTPLHVRVVRTWGVALARAEGFASGLVYQED